MAPATNHKEPAASAISQKTAGFFLHADSLEKTPLPRSLFFSLKLNMKFHVTAIRVDAVAGKRITYQEVIA